MRLLARILDMHMQVTEENNKRQNKFMNNITNG
jgi:hypothetical protein